MNLDLAFIPCSKKNNTEIRQVGRRRWIAPNKRVEREQHCIRTSAKTAISNGCKMLRDYDLAVSKAKLPKDHDVAMTVTLIIGKTPAGDGCRIEVCDLGIPPKRKRTGRKRDAINVPAIIADALQGVCYVDDKQIVELTVRVEHE